MRPFTSVSSCVPCAVFLCATLLAPTGVASAQAPSSQSSETDAQPVAATQLASPPPAPPNRPPFPNRANEVMPSWLRVRGEFRERVEGFSNAGFVEERDDAYFLSRVRLTATATG